MSLFDASTVAVVNDVIDDNNTPKPGETGKAMAPHDPANVVNSDDDVINIDKVLEDDSVHEAVGSDSIFGYSKSTASPSVEDNKPVVNTDAVNRQTTFQQFFASVESSVAHIETGTNPEITSSDFNPQMAVVPLDDPNISKTSDNIRDEFGVLLDNDINQNDDITPYDAENAVTLINTIRTISSESLLPIHAEDGVTYADIVHDQQYVDTYSDALADAEEKISDIRNNIEEMGGINKATAVALESIQPGILTNRVSLESFTTYPSKTNLLVSLEATEHWVTGAKVLGGAVIFGLIVKMLLWIRDKLSGTISISNKEVSKAKSKKENIVNDINSIAREHLATIRTHPTIVKNINAKCSELLKSNYSVKVDNIAEANNVFLQQYTHQQFNNYNKLQAIIIANKNINGAMDHITKFLLSKLKELEVKFTNYEGAYRSTNMMDPAQYKTDWSESGKILKELGFENKPQDDNKIGDYTRSVIITLSKTKNAIPTYDALNSNSYSPDETLGLDDVKKSIDSLLKKVTKLSEDHTTFPDKSIGNNRQQIGGILKAEVNNLMGMSLSALAIRNAGNGICKKLVNVVVNTDNAWKAVFKGSPIKYGQS